MMDNDISAKAKLKTKAQKVTIRNKLLVKDLQLLQICSLSVYTSINLTYFINDYP